MMRIFIVIIAFCGVTIALAQNEWIKVENPLNRRITGGKDAELGQFPYQALLKLKDGSSSSTYLCGGTLIAKNWILTAAHCVVGKVSGRVFVGLVDSNPMSNSWVLKVNQEDLIVHENYDFLNFTNDIGLIRLATEIPQDRSVNYISLPLRAEPNDYLVRKIGTVSGFGTNADNTAIFWSSNLKWIHVTIIENEVCEKLFGKKSITNSSVCVDTKGGKSPCFGDSGGPITVLRSDGRTELAGVISFISTFGCEKEMPAVFTRVHSFLDWIQNKTEIQIS